MATRTCSKCKQTKDLSEFYKNPARGDGYCYHCKDCCKAYERIRKGTWYREKHLSVQKTYHRKLKQELIAAYGGRCACCGETAFEFLQIDHSNGGGGRHRKTLTVHMAAHLKAEGYPKNGYRLLCANCNSSIGLYGYCPHENHH